MRLRVAHKKYRFQVAGIVLSYLSVEGALNYRLRRSVNQNRSYNTQFLINKGKEKKDATNAAMQTRRKAERKAIR